MFKRTLAILWIFTGVLCHSSEIPLHQNITLREEILANATSSIEYIDGSKIYFHPEALKQTQEGIFLELDDEQYFLLPHLYSDNIGYFLNLDARIPRICDQCGRKYIVFCSYPECPINIKKREAKQKAKDKKNANKNS